MSSLLRKYVRSVLLESVSADGLAVILGMPPPLWPVGRAAVLIDVAVFNASFEANEKKEHNSIAAVKIAAKESVVGYISCSPPSRGEAWGAWEVTAAAGKGYGKILYSIGYALSPKGRLMPDRSSVSDSAREAWRGASRTHDSLQLDPLPTNNLTDTEEDDAVVHNEEGMEFLDRVYIAKGTEPDMVNQLIGASNKMKSDLNARFHLNDDDVDEAFLSAGRLFFTRNTK